MCCKLLKLTFELKKKSVNNLTLRQTAKNLHVNSIRMYLTNADIQFVLQLYYFAINFEKMEKLCALYSQCRITKVRPFMLRN